MAAPSLRALAKQSMPQGKLDCFVASAPLRKRFAFVASNDGDRPVDNPVHNLSITPWIRWGKPGDDPVEKRVHKQCKSVDPFYEKAGYVPVDKAVHDRCVYGRIICERLVAHQFEISEMFGP